MGHSFNFYSFPTLVIPLILCHFDLQLKLCHFTNSVNVCSFDCREICSTLTSNFEMQTFSVAEHRDRNTKWIISWIENVENSMWLRRQMPRIDTILSPSQIVRCCRGWALNRLNRENKCRCWMFFRLNKICIENAGNELVTILDLCMFFHVFSINSQDVFGIFSFSSPVRFLPFANAVILIQWNLAERKEKQ